ncbi:MAG: hypothetical protein ABI828_02805, partial [Actinomycetota bacterium]
LGAPGLVAGVAADGVFLSNQAMSAQGLSTANVSSIMSSLRAPGGKPLFQGAFPGFAVGFGKYC